MVISSAVQAMKILNDVREDAAIREAAIRYLVKDPTPTVIVRLVQALQDDDFSVRWEAANAIAQQGETAVLEVLKALTDGDRVGDPRLRECAYHVLHSNAAAIPVPISSLLEALHGGPAADIASLVEADQVLRAWVRYRSVEARAARQSKTSNATQANLFHPHYGPARLTGGLGRLAKR